MSRRQRNGTRTKAAHHTGTHQVRAKRVTDRANANPNTVCLSPDCIGWGTRTLAEHPKTKTGNPPSWDAGHVVRGQPNGALQPEVNVCNRSVGASEGNADRNEPSNEKWW